MIFPPRIFLPTLTHQFAYFQPGAILAGMKSRHRYSLVSFLLAAMLMSSGCTDFYEWNGSLEDFLRSQPHRFADVMRNPETYRLQVIYTQIDRDPGNRPTFTSFRYRVDANEYFYPASTVKLPTALLALEKINKLNIDGLTRDTTMITGVADDSQSPVITDSTSPTGLPTIGHYIRKILLVSDNDAFNRLYEFLGQKSLNEALQAKAYTDTRIMHRLELALSIEANQKTNPVVFIDGDQVIFEQSAQKSDIAFVNEAPILLGKAEIISGELHERPKDFAEKNAYSLQDMHDVILALIFPDAVAEGRRFSLTEDDYQFVYRNMSAYPGDSGIDEYSGTAEYPDGYVKFLMFGGNEERIPPHIRIFNKVGDAYGFLSDAAYVIDTENGVEFILAATIYTNANHTFNDNLYEYDEIGLPFLRELGQAVYELELAREKTTLPDFSSFSFLE